jgi:hypothetical protein
LTLDSDVEENTPQQLADLRGEAVAAAQKLQAALDQFKDIRPADPDPPQVLGQKKRKKN